MKEILLAWCLINCPDVTPPHMVVQCVASVMKDTSHLTPMGCGIDMMTGQLKCGTGMIWTIETTTVCTKREPKCVWGKDYDGPKECAP